MKFHLFGKYEFLWSHLGNRLLFHTSKYYRRRDYGHVNIVNFPYTWNGFLCTWNFCMKLNPPMISQWCPNVCIKHTFILTSGETLFSFCQYGHFCVNGKWAWGLFSMHAEISVCCLLQNILQILLTYHWWIFLHGNFFADSPSWMTIDACMEKIDCRLYIDCTLLQLIRILIASLLC